MESARDATQADLVAISTLIGHAIDELRPQRGAALFLAREARADPTSIETDLETAAGDARQLVVAGTIDEVIVGYAVAHLEDLRDGGCLAVVDDLYVDPEARQVGVGEAVMEHLLDWARSHGCVGIDAVALPGNRETKNFFERFGLTARAILVHRDLREPDGDR